MSSKSSRLLSCLVSEVVGANEITGVVMLVDEAVHGMEMLH